MAAPRSDGLLLPALAGCVLGAASVLGIGLLVAPDDSAAPDAASALPGHGDAAHVVAASTAPAPATVTLPGTTASAGDAAAAGDVAAAAGSDPVRRHRRGERAPSRAGRPPSRTEQIPNALVAPAPVLLELAENRSGRLVIVRIVDPGASATASRTRRVTGSAGHRKPAARKSQPTGSSRVGSSQAGSSPAGPSQTWRHGTIAAG